MSRRVAAPVVDIFACLFSVQERTPPSRAWRVGFATRANINFTDRVYGSKMVCVSILKIPGAIYPQGGLSTLERRLSWVMDIDSQLGQVGLQGFRYRVVPAASRRPHVIFVRNCAPT